MWRVLRTKQAIGLIAFVVVIVPTFLLLSRWQLHRWDERKAYNTQLEAGIAAAPTGVDRVIHVGASPDQVSPDVEYRLVNATGRYDVSGQVLVRLRTSDSQNGFWVVTPFTSTVGATLLVNRGWVPAGKDATSTPSVPAPAAGLTSVTGRIRLTEASDGVAPADLPTGQVTSLAVSDLLARLGARGYPAYVELTASTPPPAAGITLIPEPEITEGPHLSYAVQWIFLAVMAVGGLIYLLTLEVRRRRPLAVEAEEPTEARDRDTQMGDATTS